VRGEARDVIDASAAAAHDRRATQVVLPYHPPGGRAVFAKRSTADELLRRLPHLEIHLVAEDPSER
jgi:K+-sensing histidine kinase KdpD